MRAFVKRDIDRVYEKLLLVGVYLYNKQAKKWFKELRKLKSYSDFVNLSPFVNNGLQKILEKSMMLAYLTGHDSMQREIKAQINKYGEKKLADTGSAKQVFDIQVGFDEAVRKLKLKKIIPADEFKNASTQIKQTSFSVQKIERQNALVSVKESLIRAIDTGMDFKDWKNKEMMYVFAKHGITPLNPHHLETVFRTNLGTVYETARNESAMADPNVEGWERFGIGDSRQSQVCINLDGSKYAKDDPIWESISPLSHHACRCTKIPITMAYKKTNNIKWSKKPPKKTLDMVGKDFRNNPKNLKQYNNKVSKKLINVEKKNIELNNNIKQSLKPKTEAQYSKEATEYWNKNKVSKEILKKYTEDEFHRMNNYLRTGKLIEGPGIISSPIQRRAYTNRINTLSKSLKKSPQYKGDVFRGMKLNDKEIKIFLKDVKDQGFFIDKGFTSTTTNQESMQKLVNEQYFMGTDKNVAILRLKTKKGAYLNGGSSYPTEREVLFSPGSKIIINSIKKTGGKTKFAKSEYTLKGVIE